MTKVLSIFLLIISSSAKADVFLGTSLDINCAENRSSLSNQAQEIVDAKDFYKTYSFGFESHFHLECASQATQMLRIVAQHKSASDASKHVALIQGELIDQFGESHLTNDTVYTNYELWAFEHFQVKLQLMFQGELTFLSVSAEARP